MDAQKSIGAHKPVDKDEDLHLEKHSDAQDRPLSPEEKLEESLEDSMDASDPPSATQPGDHGDPVPSSGFKEENEDAKD
ncbi:hypothetical protein BH10PSE12_BH10PSE12_10490 [soil metagenome]